MLVLAMEFSRDARRPESYIASLGGRPYGIRERPTVSYGTVGIATEVTEVTPSKRNSEVRQTLVLGIRGRPGISQGEGHGRTAAAEKRKKAE
jgi:hypothetical protein